MDEARSIAALVLVFLGEVARAFLGVPFSAENAIEKIHFFGSLQTSTFLKLMIYLRQTAKLLFES